MRIHRFYVPAPTELKHDFWLHDEKLIHQWHNVLRFAVGQELVLFDGTTHDRLYKIDEIKDNEAHLLYVTDFERKLPKHEVYLLWSLLKKDKNDWILQKATELGVSNFVPLLADRSEKTGFNQERAQKIVIEASEQCGRSDIPSIREPLGVNAAVAELSGKVNLYICEQSDATNDLRLETNDSKTLLGVFVGPEGGWSDQEKELFKSNNIKHLNLHDFTLRAETAAVAAISKFL